MIQSTLDILVSITNSSDIFVILLAIDLYVIYWVTIASLPIDSIDISIPLGNLVQVPSCNEHTYK